jgi:hypothetical protein
MGGLTQIMEDKASKQPPVPPPMNMRRTVLNDVKDMIDAVSRLTGHTSSDDLPL